MNLFKGVKRLTAGLLALLAVMGLFAGGGGLSPAKAAAKILFSDNFESGTISTGRWTIMAVCPFTVTADPDDPGNKVLCCPRGKGEDSWSKITTKQSFRNFTLTMRIYVVGELSGTVGFSARVTGSDSFQATFNHVWKGQFGYSGGGDIYTENMLVTGNTWHNVRFIADGHTYELYIDGELRCKASDSHLTAGPLEFSYWNKLFYMDDIVIQEGREDEPKEDTSGNKTYYVDSGAPVGGDGLTPQTAWRSVAQVNQKTSFYPGDKILFKRGCTFSGRQLMPKGSGQEGRPITIGSYGQGTLPVIDYASKNWNQSTITLTNQSYWVVENVQIQSSNPAAPGFLEDPILNEDGSGAFPMRGGMGIDAKYIDGQNSFVVRGIVVRNCRFTLVDTSGGDDGNSYKNATGKVVGSGGGALSISASSSEDGRYNAWVDGFTVENCVFYNCGGTAVSSGFGGQLPNKNVVVRNNLMYCDENFGASNHAVYLANTDGAVVEYNTVRNLTCGMAFQNSRNGTMRYNVVMNMDGYMHSASKLAGRPLYWDACGLDVDAGCGGTMTLEGNLTYRCQDVALAAFEYKPSPKCRIVYKNNVSYEDGTLFYFDAQTLNYKLEFLNNTVVRTAAAREYATELITQMRRFGSTPLRDPETFRFENNVFYFPDGFVRLDEEFCVYSGNLFTGKYPSNAALVAGKNVDTLLRIPTAAQMKNLSFCGNAEGTSGWYSSRLFAPLSGSPCLSGGKTVAGVDFDALKKGADTFAALYPPVSEDPGKPSVPPDTPKPTNSSAPPDTPGATNPSVLPDEPGATDSSLPPDASDGEEPSGGRPETQGTGLDSQPVSNGTPGEEPPPLGEGGSGALTVVLVIAAVLVLAAGGTAVWWILRKKKAIPPAAEDEGTQAEALPPESPVEQDPPESGQ